MNTRIKQLIIPAVLGLFLATTASFAADAKKNPPPPPPPPNTNPPPDTNIGTFTLTGSMNVPREGHSLILLNNGQVLAVNGDTTGANSAELYDPASGTWSFTATPLAFHQSGSATLLANGEVLLAGGNDFTTPLVAAAELYNPSTRQWTMTGSLPTARDFQATVLLPNGQVLVAGGEDSTFSALADAELYNPATGTWQPTASMHQARYGAVAGLLGDGTVLVAGGRDISNDTNNTVLKSAEIYNPSTGNWTMIANMPTNGGPAVTLANGDVLVVRGAFYDPGTGTWTTTPPIPSIIKLTGPSTATVLTNGEVLLTGFRSTYNLAPSEPNTFLYNFATNGYVAGPAMKSPRTANAAALLPNGQVLVSGGFHNHIGGTDYFSSAELYTPPSP